MSKNYVTARSEFLPANTSSTVDKPKRYHPALVALHWLIALLMFSAVFLNPEEEGRERFRPGAFPPPNVSQPREFPATDEDAQPGSFTSGVPTIDVHMILGAAILVLMTARLLVRWRTKHPEWASTGNPLLDKLGELTHLGLYVLTFGILVSGGYLAYQRGLIASVLGTGATAVTRGGAGFLLGALHGLSWNLLFLLLFLHVGATLYHQFILKDDLLGRMWFGKQTE